MPQRKRGRNGNVKTVKAEHSESDEEERGRTYKKQKIAPLPSCSICTEDYESAPTSNARKHDLRPRVLGCGNSCCSHCLYKLAQQHRGPFRCPTCNEIHPFPVVPAAAGAGGLRSAVESSFPLNREVIRSIEERDMDDDDDQEDEDEDEGEEEEEKTTPQKLCTFPKCSTIATNYCGDCHELCTQHERETHRGSWSNHKRRCSHDRSHQSSTT